VSNRGRLDVAPIDVSVYIWPYIQQLSMREFEVSIGDIRDLGVLVEHRQKMWKAIYPDKADAIDSIEDLTREWLKDDLSRGTMIPFIARTDEGIVAGSGCIMLKEDQPRPSSLKIDNPYLLSVYTEEKYRNRGVATRIVRESIDWSKKMGYDRMTLHASPDGRSLYESLGFAATNEMRLWF